ncbi:MAG: hypothetical protein HS127_12535 [Planctomycetia bacterium]|nr:hypothetical protein [Planctomycetia bacterium]
MREDFQRFWEYKYPAYADRFLENWITRTLKTNLEPMKKWQRCCAITSSSFSTGSRLMADFLPVRLRGLTLRRN